MDRPKILHVPHILVTLIRRKRRRRQSRPSVHVHGVARRRIILHRVILWSPRSQVARARLIIIGPHNVLRIRALSSTEILLVSLLHMLLNSSPPEILYFVVGSPRQVLSNFRPPTEQRLILIQNLIQPDTKRYGKENT